MIVQELRWFHHRSDHWEQNQELSLSTGCCKPKPPPNKLKKKVNVDNYGKTLHLHQYSAFTVLDFLNQLRWAQMHYSILTTALNRSASAKKEFPQEFLHSLQNFYRLPPISLKVYSWAISTDNYSSGKHFFRNVLCHCLFLKKENWFCGYFTQCVCISPI